MKKYELSRRAMLRGVGGVAVGLPVLEMMGAGGKAQVPAAAHRFVLSFAGMAIVRHSVEDDLLVPSTTGSGFEIRRALAPIEAMGLRDEAMLVSGLKIPWGNDPSSVPGGRAPSTPHFRTWACQLAGTHTTALDGKDPRDSTADNIVAGAIGAGTPHDVLRYNLRGVKNHEISHRNTDGRTSAVSSIRSPRFAYENLFADGAPVEGNADEMARAELLSRRRRSVLDLVRGNTERLSRRLGRVDARRMDQHFSFIRDLETRLDALDMPTGAGCVAPDNPGVDGDESQIVARADVFTRLIAMGFACDLSRSASFMQSWYKCYIPMDWVNDDWGGEDMHSFSHNGGISQAAVADSISFFVKNMSQLAAHLREIPSVGGANMLDHTAMVTLFETGRGYDPDANERLSPHSTENMVALVFGGAGGLKRGHHIQTDEAHPAQVVISAMQAVGVETDRLGEVEGGLSELRS